MPKRKPKRRYKIVRSLPDVIPADRLYYEATIRGMTVKELVDYMAQRNRNHEGKRNRSAFYVREPKKKK